MAETAVEVEDVLNCLAELKHRTKEAAQMASHAIVDWNLETSTDEFHARGRKLAELRQSLEAESKLLDQAVRELLLQHNLLAYLCLTQTEIESDAHSQEHS